MFRCNHCFAENPSQAKFCMQCGQPLVATAAPRSEEPAPNPVQGENRIVTVLFADIAGSTRLAESLGAEAWHHVLNQFFAAVSTVIERAGGTVNQYTGDGVMALFGAPHALENHALSACVAALEAQVRIEHLADKVRLEHGVNFGVRMGLNSGAAVVGSIADGTRQDFTAQGATVHVAARMEQLAQPGSVFLTRNTASLVEGYCDLRLIGQMQVKGVDEPVEVSELRAVRNSTQRLDRSRLRGLSPFVGRQAERELIQQAYADAVVNGAGGRVVILNGDAGLGKSRLCAEMLDTWKSQGHVGATILRCAPVSQGEAQPLAPLRAMLARWLGVAPGMDSDEARRCVAGSVMLEHQHLQDALPALLDFLQISDAQRNVPLAPDVLQRQQRALPELFCHSFSRRPVILWIDDWHWIDDATHAHLALWLPELLQKSDALVMLTTRPIALPDWLTALPGQFVDLKPINEAEMLQLCKVLVGDWITEHPLGQKLSEHAEGNPYFIEEAVAHLVDSGVLEGPRGNRRLIADAPGIDLPQSVQSLLAARIDRLSRSAREVLECAGLIGRDFSQHWLTAMVGLDSADLQTQLDELVNGGFLESAADLDQLRFTHGLLLEEARRRQLATVSRERYAKLAQWVAQEIEAERVPVEQLPRLAVFWERAGDNMAAAQTNLAGMQHTGRFGIAEAMRLGQLAQQQVERVPVSSRQEQLRFQIHAGLLRGSTFWDVPHFEHQQWIDASEEYLARNEDPYAQVEFWMSTATHSLNHGDARNAFLQVRRAMALEQSLGKTDLVSRFRVPILLAHLARGAIARGLWILDVDDHGAWREGPPRQENFASRGFRALLLAAAGYVNEAISELEGVIRFSEDSAVPVSWMYGNLVEMRLAQGRTEGLEALARQATEAARNFGSSTFDELANRALALVIARNGEPRRALELLQSWSSHMDPGKPGELFASAHAAALSGIALLAGEQKLALAKANRAVAIARQQGQLYWLVRALAARLRVTENPRDRRQLQRLLNVTGVRFVPELAGAIDP